MKKVLKVLLTANVIVLVCLACEVNNCDHELIEYDLLEQPFIYITGRSSKPCVYSMSMAYWIDSLQFESNGELIFKSDTILLNVDSLKNSMIPYFIFSMPIGERYTIKLENKIRDENEAVFEAYIQDVKRFEGKDVYIFRVIGGFTYKVYQADLVYFVTKENGVIGCYKSVRRGNDEIYLGFKGEVLSSIIEYDPAKNRVIM